MFCMLWCSVFWRPWFNECGMEEVNEKNESTSSDIEEVTQKIVLHVYDDESREFTSLTTYHGMIRIYSSETWPSRIFWSLVVVTCLTLFMIHSGLMLLFYHSHPTFFKTTNILLTEAYLPLVTVCKVGGTHQWRKYPRLQSQEHLVSLFNSMLVGDSLDANDMRKLELLEELYTMTEGENFNMNEFLRENRVQCEEFVKTVRIGDRLVKNHCAISHWSLTDVGYCSTFEWKEVSSSSHPIRIDVVSEPDEVIVFHVHPENTAFASNSERIYVPRGKSAKLVIQPKKKIHLRSGQWGDCMAQQIHTTTYSETHYTKKSCEKYCIVENYIQRCGCVPFFADPQNLRACNLTETITCRGKDAIEGKSECHCPVDCDLVDYSHSLLSYLKTSQRNLSSIEIQMQSRQLQVNEQMKRIKAVDLLSYVAGSMGLFLGMSCVTLLEIFIYLFKSVWGVFNDQRHKTYYLENLLGVNDNDSSASSHEEIVITTKTRRSSVVLSSAPTAPVMPTVEDENIELLEKPNDPHRSRLKIEIVRHPMGRRRSSYAHHLGF
ncbi:hypothetical protein RB195_026245 [Necator americanus]|uniref:Amiloride-sensitive sodium channel n=1 Tax=Necator americanus TaxID=51031 RepID=A0ABR1EW31_NECAM